MKPYIYHVDPGHGWIAVKRSELAELGILSQISEYSFTSKSGQTVYLEEDRDASLFVKAFEAKFKSKPVLEESNHDRAPCRSMRRFGR